MKVVNVNEFHIKRLFCLIFQDQYILIFQSLVIIRKQERLVILVCSVRNSTIYLRTSLKLLVKETYFVKSQKITKNVLFILLKYINQQIVLQQLLLNQFTVLKQLLKSTIPQILYQIPMNINYTQEGMDKPTPLPDKQQTQHYLINFNTSPKKLKPLNHSHFGTPSINKNPFLLESDTQNPYLLSISGFENNQTQNQKSHQISKVKIDNIIQNQYLIHNSQQKGQDIQNQILFGEESNQALNPFKKSQKTDSFGCQIANRIVGQTDEPQQAVLAFDNVVIRIFPKTITLQKKSLNQNMFIQQQSSNTNLIFRADIVLAKQANCEGMQNLTLRISQPVSNREKTEYLYANLSIKQTQLQIWNAYILKLKSSLIKSQNVNSIFIIVFKEDCQILVQDNIQLQFAQRQDCDDFKEIIIKFLAKNTIQSVSEKQNISQKQYQLQQGKFIQGQQELVKITQIGQESQLKINQKREQHEMNGTQEKVLQKVCQFVIEKQQDEDLMSLKLQQKRLILFSEQKNISEEPHSNNQIITQIHQIIKIRVYEELNQEINHLPIQTEQDLDEQLQQEQYQIENQEFTQYIRELEKRVESIYQEHQDQELELEWEQEQLQIQEFVTPIACRPRLQLPQFHSTIFQSSREYIQSSMSNNRQNTGK